MADCSPPRIDACSQANPKCRRRRSAPRRGRAPMTKVATPLFRSRRQPGYLPELEADPRTVVARKRIDTIQARFAAAHETIQTREGLVHVSPGDAVMTGKAGEHWRVSRDRFLRRYQPVPPTVAGQSGPYE